MTYFEIYLLIAYLCGLPIGYILYKKQTIRLFGEWTIADRRIGLVISIFSWINCIIYLLMEFISSTDGEDEKANW